MLYVILLIFSLSNLQGSYFLHPISNISNRISCQLTPDSNEQIVFKGTDIKIAYTNYRKLQKVEFKIRNLGQEKKKVKLISLSLIRGNSEDNLPGSRIRSNKVNNSEDYLTLKPNFETKVNFYFDPFTMYEGTIYSIKAVINIDGNNYEATSTVSFFRHEYGDRNLLKNK